MRSVICALLSAGIAVGGSSAIFAQEVYPDEPYYEYTEPEDRPDMVVPLRPTSCGEFHYWDGKRCVDARVVPPDIR